MRVLIIGRTKSLYDAAIEISRYHDICGVITARAAPEYAVKEENFEVLAQSLGCPYVCTQSLKEKEICLIKECAPDIAVSVNWVSVIRSDVSQCFPKGILNAHFGDLPRYRGNAVTNWSIIRHESSISLTIHFMEPGVLDSGDVVVQKEMQLGEQTTIAEINEFAATNVPLLFKEALDRVEVGGPFISQNMLGVSPFRCYPRVPSYSKINWEDSAANIHALVRASTIPYSGAYTYLEIGGIIKKLYIWKSRIVAADTLDIGYPGHVIMNNPETGESHIFTGSGILAIKECQYDGEDVFNPGSKWRSIRMRLGIDIEEHLIRLQNGHTATV